MELIDKKTALKVLYFAGEAIAEKHLKDDYEYLTGA